MDDVFQGFNLFQFTPLREGRLRLCGHRAENELYFNSRPCVRGDRKELVANIQSLNFNSRPCVRGDYF